MSVSVHNGCKSSANYCDYFFLSPNKSIFVTIDKHATNFNDVNSFVTCKLNQIIIGEGKHAYLIKYAIKVSNCEISYKEQASMFT